MSATASDQAIAVFRQFGERDAVIGQHRMDDVTHGLDQLVQESSCSHSVRLIYHSGERERRCAVDRDAEL
ncbi:hypothetical protein G6L88_20140 [Rhizobium skierniewicense]|nr:hypothetical protein [Rhizobium skierniewicense]